MISQTTQDQTWSQWEFEQVDLGDKRLNTRLKKLAEDLSGAPEAPINQASDDWAATKAAYRLSPHQSRTRERMSQEPIVLAVQDTSYLNFSSHAKTRGLGPIGDRRAAAQGLVTHNILAVTPQGLPLGLLDQKTWAREGYNQQTKRERKNTSIEYNQIAVSVTNYSRRLFGCVWHDRAPAPYKTQSDNSFHLETHQSHRTSPETHGTIAQDDS